MRYILLTILIFCGGCGRYALQRDVDTINIRQQTLLRVLASKGVIEAKPVSDNAR